MIRRQRLALHLTPLLDLLLIVLFAQYMEVRDEETVRDQNLSERSRQLASVEQRLAELQPQLAQLEALRLEASTLQQQYRVIEGQLGESRIEIEQLALQNTILHADVQRIESQQAVLGELLSRLFQVPADQVEAVLDPNRAPPLSESPTELQQLRQEFAAMAQQTPGQTIMHLLTYHEIRKWCDVWELRVDRNFFTLTAGDEEFRRRLPVTSDGLLDAAAAQVQLFDVMRSLGAPKELVVILVSFDRSCLIDTETQIRRIMPDLVAQYRANIPGDKQVHYADFGHGFE